MNNDEAQMKQLPKLLGYKWVVPQFQNNSLANKITGHDLISSILSIKCSQMWPAAVWYQRTTAQRCHHYIIPKFSLGTLTSSPDLDLLHLTDAVSNVKILQSLEVQQARQIEQIFIKSRRRDSGICQLFVFQQHAVMSNQAVLLNLKTMVTWFVVRWFIAA